MQRIWVLAVFLFAAAGALATIFGSVRGVVHELQHRRVPGITVVIKARNSEFTRSVQTNSEGEFHFEVPLGEYTVSISDETFLAQPQTITALSGTAPILHLELRLPSEKETVTVSADEGQSGTVTPSTLVERLPIQETPGASRSNSLAMITDFVPGRNGGLTDFSFGGGCGLLDHDQRNTLHVGGQFSFPWHVSASTDIS